MTKQPTMTIQEAEGLLADLDRLEQWLAERPADGRFSYLSSSDCVLCQYLKANGAPESTRFGGFEFSLSGREYDGDIPELVALVASLAPYTFGGMLEKLRAERARGAKP